MNEIVESVGLNASSPFRWPCRRGKRPPATRVGQPKASQSAADQLAEAAADEIEQQKKLAERARRFAGPPTLAARPGTKRPSDQGVDAVDGQSAVKQMRLLASRKVVARAKATVVQQHSVVQQRQQQQLRKTVAAGPLPAAQKPGECGALLLIRRFFHASLEFDAGVETVLDFNFNSCSTLTACENEKASKNLEFCLTGNQTSDGNRLKVDGNWIT